jgi:hypothetical protein
MHGSVRFARTSSRVECFYSISGCSDRSSCSSFLHGCLLSVPGTDLSCLLFSLLACCRPSRPLPRCHRQTYRERAAACLEALEHPKWRGLLTTETKLERGGGFYIWARIGSRVVSSAQELDSVAREQFGVGIKAGTIFACPGKGAEDGGGQAEELGHSLRICIAFYEQELLLEALNRLHLALQHQANLYLHCKL